MDVGAITRWLVGNGFDSNLKCLPATGSSIQTSPDAISFYGIYAANGVATAAGVRYGETRVDLSQTIADGSGAIFDIVVNL